MTYAGSTHGQQVGKASGQSRWAKLLSAADHLRAGLQAQQGAQTQGRTEAYQYGTAVTYCIGRFKMSMLLVKPVFRIQASDQQLSDQGRFTKAISDVHNQCVRMNASRRRSACIAYDLPRSAGCSCTTGAVKLVALSW